MQINRTSGEFKIMTSGPEYVDDDDDNYDGGADNRPGSGCSSWRRTSCVHRTVKDESWT